MKRFFVLLTAFGLSACTQQQSSLPFRSLEASGDVAFLCLEGDGTPHDRAACGIDAGPSGEQTFVLVTQTHRGEVAVVRPFSASGRVVDVEPSVPGNGFLPIGAQPVDIVSTPGSVATFVGVAEVGREGIFALPSSCVLPRSKDAPPRDLTTWPACRLPAAPGEMAILIDPPGEDGTVRTSCGAESGTGSDGADAATHSECPADLSLEQNPPGRRKLAVSLPNYGENGEIWVIDAQRLLDREPGTYDECEVDHRIALDVDLPSEPVAEVPADGLDVSGCTPARSAAPSADISGTPAGFAHDTERQILYVADSSAPVVHVLDTSDPCALRERPPLLPASFQSPGTIVTTRRIAVSPRTTDNRQYLYAVDDKGGGNVMVFDVSIDSTERTPLMLPRSDKLPFQPPDRIVLDAPVQDLAFVRRDRVQVDPELGSAQQGISCEPDPTRNDAPGARYRPSNDLSSGARAGLLRGVFGYLALDNAQIAIVDVEDFDAPCRRPVAGNPSSEEDFRGCRDDPVTEFSRREQDPTSATVTGEQTCHVVEPHRLRSAQEILVSDERGVRAPSLRAFPRLTTALGRTLPTNQTEEGKEQPMMLGVDFSEDHPAQVFVGTQLFRREVADPSAPTALVIDPALAETSSLVLRLDAPRAFPPNERFSATYNGLIVFERRSGLLQGEGTQRVLVDGGAGFCSQGILDMELARELAEERLGIPAEDEDRLSAFAERHADYVTITSDFPDEDSAHWKEAGAECALDPNAEASASGYRECQAVLGTARAPQDLRELRIIDATSTSLVVEPRRRIRSNVQKRDVLRLLSCCFPEPVSYTVRASNQWIVRGSASGFQHNVTSNAQGQCVESTCALQRRMHGRVFEVTCDPESAACTDDDGLPIIGLATENDVACIVDDPREELKVLGGERPGCIFANVKMAFAMYRGRARTEPGMTFTWDVAGGFTPMAISLTRNDGPNTIPESLVYSAAADRLALTDAATKGLVLIDPGTGSISTIF